jgi:beta-mannanase
MAPRKRRAQRVASTTSKLGRRVGVALASLGLALGSLGTGLLTTPAHAYTAGALSPGMKADTWVNPSSPNTTYGAATTMQVASSATTGNSVIYFKVDRTGVAGTLQESRLTVKLTPSTRTPSGSQSAVLFRLDGDPSQWTENGLTYNNRIPCSGVNGLQISDATPLPASSTSTFTIATNAANINPMPTATTYHFCLRINGDPTSAGPYTFKTKEASSGKPVVTVNWVKDTTPVANDDVAATSPGTPVSVAVVSNDTDADGDALVVDAITTPPANGTATINSKAKGITYTPAAGFCGGDRFEYRVKDTTTTASYPRPYIADTAVVTITMPCPPVANPDAATFSEDSGVQINVLANDSDANGDALTIVSATQPSNGTRTIAGNSITYVPTAGYYGNDSFSYTITDGSQTATATVTLTRNCTVSPILVRSCGAWFGAAAEGTIPKFNEFEAKIGRAVQIAHFYHTDEEVFPTTAERDFSLGAGGSYRLLFENWKPGTRSGTQSDLTWAQVAGGQADAHLLAVADQIHAYGKPLFVTINHEADNDALGTGYTTSDYVAMFRHVQEVVDARLSTLQSPARVVWVWNVTGYAEWESRWTAMYPGDDYVDWIAYDPYTNDPAATCTFACIANRTWSTYPSFPGFYAWAQANYPNKPLMLGEWAVGESVASPSGAKTTLFNSIPSVSATQFPNLKAQVYFNNTAETNLSAQSWVWTSESARVAYANAVANTYFQRTNPEQLLNP